MPTRTRLLASLTCALTLVLAWAAPAWASFSGDVGALVNSSRAAAGLSSLSTHGGLAGVAQAWAEHLADVGELSHNPSYSTQIPSGWTSAAENVAYNSAPTAAAMHGQLMNSPEHRANILGDFTHLGVGYAVDAAGGGWLVEVFATYPGAATTPPSDPSAAPTSAAPTGGPGGPGSSEPTTAATTAVPDGWLGPGSSGPQVQALQEDLAALGYDVVADGEFGTQTGAQLTRFQTDAGLQADGLAGPQTLAAIAASIAAQEGAAADPTDEATEDATDPTGEATEETTEAAPSAISTDTTERQAEPVPLTATREVSGGLPVGALIGVSATLLVAIAALLVLRRRTLTHSRDSR